MRKVGILGGSFNPIHNGHIALAQQMLVLASLEEVWLMVSPQNPLKPVEGLADEQQRFRLAQTAADGVPGVKASDYEFLLPRPSYTWDTLTALRNDFPDTEFTLLIGGDNWAHFERWYHWKDILRHHRVAVYPRGNDQGTIDARLMDISSTDIRQRVRRGESIERLVPASILEQVKEVYGK